MRKTPLLVVAVAALAVVPIAAAHVEPTPEKATAGGTSAISFTVGHGCEGSPTRQMTMEIPAGVTSAKPKAKAGWKIAIKTGKLPQPVKDFAGNTVTTGVLQITWTGGPLSDAWFDTFDVLLGMPNTPGKTVYFRTVQRCTKGTHRWIEIPVAGQDEPEEPAPGVALVKGTVEHD
jgi:uncharacterized protein YcnI